MYVGCLESCRRRTGISSALRAPRPLSRREVGPFRLLLPLPSPPGSTLHPGRAFPVTFSSALAAGASAEVRQTGPNAGMYSYARVLLAFQNTKMVSIYLLLNGGERYFFCTVWPNGETGTGALALFLRAQREGFPRARHNGGAWRRSN